MSALTRTQSSLTVAQPSALLPRSHSVSDIRNRAGFDYSTRRPLTHYSNFPYRYYHGNSVTAEPSYPHRYLHTNYYGNSQHYNPSQLRSYYRREPNYYDYPNSQYRWSYGNRHYDHDVYRKWHNPYYGSLFNYWSPYRSSHYVYHLTGSTSAVY